MNGRPWTTREDEHLRQWYGRKIIREVGMEIGRSNSSVYQRAKKLGLTTTRVWATDDQIITALRELNPRGLSDAEIAVAVVDRTGCESVDRHRVGQLRKDLGLADNSYSEHRREQVRQKTRQQLQQAGLPSLAALRSSRFNQWKRDLGWPESLTVRAVQALEMFYRHGSLTRIQLCALLGVCSKKRTAPTSNAPGGTVLAELQAAGLISRLHKAVKVPFDTRVHDEAHRLRPRKTNRKIRDKYLDLYLLKPGVVPHGRKTTERTQAG